MPLRATRWERARLAGLAPSQLARAKGGFLGRNAGRALVDLWATRRASPRLLRAAARTTSPATLQRAASAALAGRGCRAQSAPPASSGTIAQRLMTLETRPRGSLSVAHCSSSRWPRWRSCARCGGAGGRARSSGTTLCQRAPWTLSWRSESWAARGSGRPERAARPRAAGVPAAVARLARAAPVLQPRSDPPGPLGALQLAALLLRLLPLNPVCARLLHPRASPRQRWRWRWWSQRRMRRCGGVIGGVKGTKGPLDSRVPPSPPRSTPCNRRSPGAGGARRWGRAG